jgi:DNA-binding transcriptional LysR family regulator
LTAFLDHHSGVSVEAVMVDRVVNLVEEGFDIAVRIGPLPASGLVATRVGQVRRVVCGAPVYLAEHGRPSHPDELALHRVVSVAPLDAGRHWRFGRTGEQGSRVNPRLSVTSVAAAIGIARQGWSLCQALSYQIGPELEDGTLETVLDDHEPEPLPIHLVHVEGRKAAAKVRAFIDFAAERLRRTPQLVR